MSGCLENEKPNPLVGTWEKTGSESNTIWIFNNDYTGSVDTGATNWIPVFGHSGKYFFKYTPKNDTIVFYDIIPCTNESVEWTWNRDCNSFSFEWKYQIYDNNNLILEDTVYERRYW